MSKRLDKLKQAEIHHGTLITNLAKALILTANMDIKNDVVWEMAILSATDFVSRIKASVSK